MAKPTNLEQRGLPSNTNAERAVLGGILADDRFYAQAAAKIASSDFSLEVNALLFSRMSELEKRGEKINYVTLANELDKRTGELQSSGGLSYIASLTDGLPELTLAQFDSFVGIVKEKSALRKLIYIARKLEDRGVLAEDKPSVILESINADLMEVQSSVTVESAITPLAIVEEYPGGYNEFLDPSKQPKGLETGFSKFDDMTNGLQRGELIIIGARPSMGKTSLCLNIAAHAAVKNHKRVVVFTLEMTKVPVLRRMMCSQARVDYTRFRAGYLNAGESGKLQHALYDLTNSPLFIDDNHGLTVMAARARLRKIEKQHGPVDLAIVDYLQLMSTPGKIENRNQEVSALSRGLKLLAKELNIPIIALSQLNRAVETRKGDRRPQLSDLRESGSIEQDADLIAMVYRAEVYEKEREDLKGLAELIVAKQRNGACGTVDLIFLGGTMRFENKAEYYEEAHGE